MPATAFLSPPNPLAASLAALSPNHAVVVAMVGLCLIFFEFNRPGRILPGALGSALLLFAVASLLHHPLHTPALLLLLVSSATLAGSLWKDLPLWLAAAATAALSASLRLLVPGDANPHINTPVALTCGFTIGLLGTFLSRIALRARRLKAVH